MTFNETEDKTLNTEIEDVQPVTEEAEPETALDDSQIRAAALAYARFLMDNDIELGEKASSGSGDPGENTEEAPADAEEDAKPQEETAEAADQKKSGKKKKKAPKASDLEKIRKREEAKARNKEKFLKGGRDPLASVTNLHDKVQDGIDGAFVKIGKDIIRGAHRITMRP